MLHLDDAGGGHGVRGHQDVVGALDADQVLHGRDTARPGPAPLRLRARARPWRQRSREAEPARGRGAMRGAGGGGERECEGSRVLFLWNPVSVLNQNSES